MTDPRLVRFSMLVLTVLPLFVLSPSAAGWTRHSFPLPEGIWSVEAIDVNADSKLDLVAMGEKRVFALVAPDWKEHLLLDTRETKMLYCAALDADGDGDLDLAIGRYRVPWIEYRQSGQTRKPPEGPDFSLAWIENTGRIDRELPLHIIDKELNGIHGLAVADFNTDGRSDLVADSINGPFFANSLLWFSAARGNEPGFRRNIVTRGGADGRPHYMDTADVNGDKRLDILLGDSQGGTFTWWEQPQDAQSEWKKHRIAQAAGATNIRPGDVNGDGVLDVVGSCGHGKGVFWYAGPGWQQHSIDPEFPSPHALAVGDFDRDGDIDVAAASFTALSVRWYRNDDGKGAFSTHEIDGANKQQAYDLKTVDLDGDKAMDLILAGRESRNAVWYRNALKDER